jgi:hypothetical protein
MSKYWARFVRRSDHTFRLDTRIYLQDVDRCRTDDPVVGAVVAKNPGSAKPSNTTTRRLQPLNLANDRLIPTVRSMVNRAYAAADSSPPPAGFIQVLNLFYLCDKDFRQATRTITQIARPPRDKAEARTFPWIMYLWGKHEPATAGFMRRFRHLDSTQHFYFDNNRNTLICDVPAEGSFARHTQGLKLQPVINHLASLLACDS